MTDTDIHELDEDTVARIAAGEVVERPASAVKELVENSLDADASRLEVAVEEGGTESIRVADDGHGMTESDLRVAVRQHTTSKIEGLEDLEAGVRTLGFRGEALHTIGSVSRLTIRSRPRDGSEAGTELVYEGGDAVSVEPAGCPEGTVVEVEDLFYNTPARQKFLKTTATEFAHVNRVVTRYALANPDVAVSLVHDGREVFSTTGQGDLQAAVLSVYGREVAAAMIPVEVDEEDLPPGPVDSISGLVSHPETNRSSREYLATYVNDRAVTSDAIREGIMGAYGTQLGSDRYPFATLFLEVPGEAVDVNVHPRKREVRFDDDDAVRRQVDSAVESALLEHGLLRSRAPRGRSAPGDARVAPDRGPSQSEIGGSSGDGSSGDDSATASPARDETVERSPASDEPPADGSTSSSVDSSPPSSPPQPSDRSERSASAESEPLESTPASSIDASEADSAPAKPEPPTEPADADAPRTDSSPHADEQPTEPSQPERDPERKFDGPTEQRTLEGDRATGEETDFDSLPPLRVLGQFGDTYIVCETPDGLALIDQHAADERVNYERLQEAFASDPPAQALAEPVELELTAAEAEAFAGYSEALERLGFYANRVDDRTVAVTTVPAVLEETLEPEHLRDVLTSFVEGDREAGAETVDALADEFLGDLACYPSVTGNTSLTEGSVVDLLAALDDCENPYACPHGRPVIVQFDEREIEERFERDYPGHGD
ncbi:DNA mismatch repair endonuclease MutL [Natronobacterium gregoryi]|uniref:DNA mismatch repair protein MutL n=2 Tax=Natronobacterium gregoryi TaxID=44930 RepID=L0AIZ3_NATGS|nr:DNA mismatch repair endonuclease MutL [Natronobacterium gregoryi]AFZ73873.1 DNA mismatch repair protein MutL [Natronobacterium gregoryi SP2]ELY65033.1 DNA mismatch repair protein MutL [Natronobacterium gregoryi SP2]PLK18410.1 DNA mismatch repair endonuclease MutL [Natronobacterium gregoryi SP2]SFJ71194.1 DNA mismatch repair protein MutL [Natronobacterium gregoryi]